MRGFDGDTNNSLNSKRNFNEILAIKIIIKHQRTTVDELKSENLNECHKIKFNFVVQSSSFVNVQPPPFLTLEKNKMSLFWQNIYANKNFRKKNSFKGEE